MIINNQEYFEDLEKLIPMLTFDIDCILASKRSGWICGVYLSNKLEKLVFTTSEIESIPSKFKNILIVDDKIFKGKTIQRIKNKLKNKNITTACLYVEGHIYPDIYVRKLNCCHIMFYE